MNDSILTYNTAIYWCIDVTAERVRKTDSDVVKSPSAGLLHHS